MMPVTTTGRAISALNRSLAAIAMLISLRQRWPDIPATETGPDECFRHLTRSTEFPELVERTRIQSEWVGVGLPSDVGETGWEAVMSAWALWMGLRGGCGDCVPTTLLRGEPTT